MTRKAVGAATVTQSLSQTSVTGEDGQPTTKIVIDQAANGGVKGTTESRTLDWQYRGHSDWLFGTVQGRSRYVTLAQILEESKGKDGIEEDAKFATEGWLGETEEGEAVESYVDNEANKWTGWQVWGFAEEKGERKFVRRITIRRKDNNEFKRVRLVYDYMGPLA